MKKLIPAVIAAVMVLLIISGCTSSYGEYTGMIQGVDPENQILYVTGTGEDDLFQDSCAIDCALAVKHESIMAIDADDASLNLSPISLSDLQPGETVRIYLSENEAKKAAGGSAEAYQIQVSRGG